MSRAARESEQAWLAQARLRVIQHYEPVTHNASLTCRFFGISCSKFCVWYSRYRKHGPAGRRELKRGPRLSPFRISLHIEALILRTRRERHYGIKRLGLFLQRYHHI